MRIGIYLGYHFKVALDGEGVGRYVIRLIEGLLRERTETQVHVLSMSPNYLEIESMLTPIKSLFADRVTIHCSDDLNWINSSIPVDLWIIPAVIIDSAQYLTKPLIVCLHDVAYIHVRELEALGKRVDGLVRLLTHKAVAVICNSSYIRTYDGLGYLRLSSEKTHLIRPAAPIEEYSSAVLRDEQSFREYYCLDKSYFAFPTVLRPHKNYVRMIDAFLKFKQAQGSSQYGPYLVFTDHINSIRHNEELLKIIRKYEPVLLNNVKFIGRVPAQDVPALYKYAAGTVVPTVFEGSCPFPILESLVMGTPVAFGRIEVAQEVIRDLSAFITFDPYSVEDMQQALSELWENGSSLAAQQKTALSCFLERNWQDVAREYYNVMQQIVDLSTPITFVPNDRADVQKAICEPGDTGKNDAAKQKAALSGLQTRQDVTREECSVMQQGTDNHRGIANSCFEYLKAFLGKFI